MSKTNKSKENSGNKCPSSVYLLEFLWGPRIFLRAERNLRDYIIQHPILDKKKTFILYKDIVRYKEITIAIVYKYQ